MVWCGRPDSGCAFPRSPGGSRGAGTHGPDSDWDFAVYYRGRFDPADLRAVGWPGEVSEVGGWGGGVFNGGAWLRVDGRKVDVHSRDLDDVEHHLDQARVGRFRIENLLFYLAGVPTYVVESPHGGGKIPLRPAEVRIRATVIGASQYTVQVSGNTIYLSHPEMLPLRNLQVITPQFEQKESITAEEVRAAVEKALQRGDALEGDRAAALAIHWELGPSYPLIRTLAEGLVNAMKDHVDQGQPLVLVFDADIAKLMGNIIERELIPGVGIVSIDGIDLKDFDFVDIGQELPDAKAVPVVIKSLIFRHSEHGRGHAH